MKYTKNPLKINVGHTWGNLTVEAPTEHRKILYEKHEHKEDAIAARQRAEGMVREFLEHFYADHPEWDRDFYKERGKN